MLIDTKKISFVLRNIQCECVVSKRREERKKKKKVAAYFFKRTKNSFFVLFFKIEEYKFFCFMYLFYGVKCFLFDTDMTFFYSNQIFLFIILLATCVPVSILSIMSTTFIIEMMTLSKMKCCQKAQGTTNTSKIQGQKDVLPINYKYPLH